MREKFESFPGDRDRIVLLQELAVTLGVKVHDALYDV